MPYPACHAKRHLPGPASLIHSVQGLFDPVRLRDGAAQTGQHVNVVFYSSDLHSGTVKPVGDSGQDGVDFGSKSGVLEVRPAFLG